MPPAFKIRLYLIHGDDHGRIAERRARLRDMAEGQGGAGVRVVRGRPGDARGRRRRAERDDLRDRPPVHHCRRRRALEGQGDGRARGCARRDRARHDRHLLRARGRPPEGAQAPAGRGQEGRRRHRRRAVGQALGAAQVGGRPGQAAGSRPTPDAARMLVGHVGERQQRLLRELEKLALELEPDAPSTPTWCSS